MKLFVPDQLGHALESMENITQDNFFSVLKAYT